MIIEFYPGKKNYFSHTRAPSPPPAAPPPVSDTIALPSNQLQPRDIKDSVAKQVSLQEWGRRDGIIRMLAQKCSFGVGQVVYPRNKEGLELYGTCKILGVCQTYHDFVDRDWPADDVPLIVHAESMVRKNGPNYVRFNCTPAYLSEKNLHQ